MAATRRTGDAALDELARECDVEFTRAGGPGGQHRNKVETAVRLTHRPSGVVIVAADHRSQARNRRLALERLAERLAEIERQRRLAEQRRKRPKTRPSRAARRRRLEEKRQVGEKKKQRRRVPPPDD
jgi:protein subunit release factor B